MRPLITSTERRKARDLKLWRRDEERASRLRETRIQCHYPVCWPRQTRLLRETVFVHCRRFRRHPSRRGSSEGEDVDSSDEEWDDFIRQQYGPEYVGVKREDLHAMDEDIPIHRVVEDAFGLADEFQAQARRNEENVEEQAFEEARREYAKMAREDNLGNMHSEGSNEDLRYMGDEDPGEQGEHVQDDEIQEPEIRFNRGLYEDADEERIRLEEASRIPLFSGASLSLLSFTLLI
jgi:hypothetical protein